MLLLYNFIMLPLPVKDTSRPLRRCIRKTIQFSSNDITIPVATLKFKILLKNVTEVRYRFVGDICNASHNQRICSEQHERKIRLRLRNCYVPP